MSLRMVGQFALCLVLTWPMLAVAQVENAPPRVPPVPAAPPDVSDIAEVPTDGGPDLVPEENYDFIWGPYIPRAGIRYDSGSSIGRTGGMTTIQGLLPIFGASNGNFLSFVDLNYLMFENSTSTGCNVGAGGRYYVEDWDRTVGGLLYYDNRGIGNHSCEQVALSLDSFGQVWDFRSNIYLPYNPIFPVSGFYADRYLGTVLLLAQYFRTAMTGADFEASYHLAQYDSLSARVALGAYEFAGTGTQDAIGPKARIEATWLDNFMMSLSVQHDQVFDTTVNLSGSVSYPRRSARRSDTDRTLRVKDRLAESPTRIQNIVVGPAYYQDSMQAVDPVTGGAYYIIHVTTSGSDTTGTGTFENPYATLGRAFIDPIYQSGNTVVFDRTTGTYTNLAQSLTITNHNYVFSSGPVQYLNTTVGTVTMPLSGTSTDLSNLPSIGGNIALTNVDVNVQYLSALSGYNVNPTATGGVTLTSSSPSFINNVLNQTGTGTAITITGASGTVGLSGNIVTQNGGELLNINNNSATIDGSSSSFTNNSSGADEAEGVTVTSNTGAITLSNVSISNSVATSDAAITLSSNSGAFTLTGGTIVTTQSANTDDTISISSNSGAISFSGVSITSHVGQLLDISSNSGSVTFSGGLLQNDSAGGGINVQNTSGAVSLANVLITGQTSGNAVSLTSNSGSFTLSDAAISVSNTANGIVTSSQSGNITGTNVGLSVAGAGDMLSVTNGSGTYSFTGAMTNAGGGGGEIFVSNSAANISLQNVFITNATSSAVFLSSNSGTFAITNSGSSTHISGSGATLVTVSGTSNSATFTGVNILASGNQTAVSVNGTTGGTTSFTGSVGATVTSNPGVSILNSSATTTFSSLAINASGTAVGVQSQTDTGVIRLQGGTVTSSSSGDAIQFSGSSGTFQVTGMTVSNSSGNAININPTSTSNSTVGITSNTITAGAVNIANASTGTLSATVQSNNVSGSSTSAFTATNSSSGTLSLNLGYPGTSSLGNTFGSYSLTSGASGTFNLGGTLGQGSTYTNTDNGNVANNANSPTTATVNGTLTIVSPSTIAAP